MERTIGKLMVILSALFVSAGAFAATYGPWGEGDSVKNPDKLGPTYLMNMPLTINGAAAVQGDCVAVYRQDSSALCGLGKVLDDTGKLTLVCYAPKDTALHFKIWVAESGLDSPQILDCVGDSDLLAPAPGSFYQGHALTFSGTQVLSRVKAPCVSPADGTTFETDSCTVQLSCETEDASIYYTTNGMSPVASADYLYTKAFAVYGTCEIIAMATKDGMVASACVTSRITRVQSTPTGFGTYGPWGDSDSVKNPDKLGPTYLMSMSLLVDGQSAAKGDCVAVFRQDTGVLCGLGKVLDDSGCVTVVCYAPTGTTLTFKVWLAESGSENSVILDCQPDLSAPSPGSFYTGHSLFTKSDEPTEWTVEKYLNNTNLTFELGGDEPHWYGLETARADCSGMMRSGAIGDEQSNWIQTTVSGSGTISFWWKGSSEFERSKKGVVTMYDYAEFTVDGESVAEIGADSSWTVVTQVVEEAGSHVFRWKYHKDESGSDGEDCAWLSEVVWTPCNASKELIPNLGENPTTEQITNVFVEAKAEDPKLAEKITTEAAYTNFSAWAKKVQPHGGGDAVGAAGVMAAQHAWVSYALGSETLLEAAPTDADLTVEAFEPKSGEDGKFDFTVSVKDVDVGGAATTEAQKEAVKENLKQVFGLEGGTSLDEGEMSSANVEIEFGKPQDGKVKFTAGPKDTDAKTFFMKVKMTP